MPCRPCPGLRHFQRFPQFFCRSACYHPATSFCWLCLIFPDTIQSHNLPLASSLDALQPKHWHSSITIPGPTSTLSSTLRSPPAPDYPQTIPQPPSSAAPHPSPQPHPAPGPFREGQSRLGYSNEQLSA